MNEHDLRAHLAALDRKLEQGAGTAQEHAESVDAWFDRADRRLDDLDSARPPVDPALAAIDADLPQAISQPGPHLPVPPETSRPEPRTALDAASIAQDLAELRFPRER